MPESGAQEGKELDSAVCQVNTRCHLPERLGLPMASDLALSTQPEDTLGAVVGASIDFKAAHKQVQVRPEEHGLQLFAFQGKLYHYRVCHFGGPFLGILVAARWRFFASPGAWVAGLEAPQSLPCVDDLLCALFRDSAPDMFALVVLFFCAIVAPISWKKAQFQDSLVWCGWEINFSHDTIQLVSAKLTNLDALIKALLGSRRVLHARQCIGLLIWATSIALLRSRASATILGPQQPTRLDALDTASNVVSLPSILVQGSQNQPSRWAPKSWKFQVAPCTALRTSRGCPALANPRGCASRTNNPYTSLSKSSQQCLTWLALCFQHSPVQPLARPRQLQALAAADACAEDDLEGKGGWAITSSQVVWFAKTWNMRAVWPCLVKPGQRCVACFETLAQLALLQATHSHIGGGRYSFSMPSGTSCSRPPGRCNFSCS